MEWVVQEQAARLVLLEKEIRLQRRRYARAWAKNVILEENLEDARKVAAQVPALAEQITRLSRSKKRFRAYWKRAVRCLTAQPKTDWHDVAVAEQAALTAAVAEKSRLEQALVETTATMNRYHGELEKERRLVQRHEAQNGFNIVKIRGLEEQLAGLRGAVESLKKSTTEGHGKARKEEGEKKVGRPLPSGDVLAQVFWQGFESSRNPGPRVPYGVLDPETRRCQEDGIQCVLDALGPHLRPADETAETLRGRLRQVSVSLDEEKAGRLRAETKVDELEGRLASERKAAELALENQKVRLEAQARAARDNFLAQLTGVHAMLTEAERRARHGELMAAALRFDLSEEEFQRISGECWALMKPAAASPQLTVDSGQLTAEEGESSTTDGTDSTDEAEAVVPDVLPKFEVCNRCMKVPPDGIVMRGRKPYCRPCLVDMAVEGGAA